MNKKLTKIFTPVDQISQGKIINSWHILQSIDALTGESPYDIKISGSLEVIGDLYLKLNEPIQDPNEGRLRYLGIDISTNKVEYVNLNSYLDPIEVDPTNRTAWNNGAGNINNNTSFGFMSFISNETGVGNTIIGAYNANELKTGYNNIVLGFNNLNLGNNPYYNIAIGIQSLYKNNSHDNIGLGIQPLYNNINGLNNISFGTKSLFSNISGSNSIAIGGNSLYNNQGSNNIAIGYKSSQNDVNGNNRISIGSFSGKVEGSDYLEIHSYRNELSSEDPLILGNFYERWFKLNGHFILNFSQNPTTDIVNTPYQLLFDEQGNAYQAERSYSVQEINAKFNQNNQETLTQLLPPTISGTDLIIKYVGEDGNIQQYSVSLATIQDKYYEHYQPIASNHWVINHNLGKKASITITDELDREIEGKITLNSTTTAIVDFNNYITGKAYCN